MNMEKPTKPHQGAVSVGHPVNVATGTLYHEFEDCELPGRIPLLFPRRYSTALLDKTPGLFGVGWHCSLELKICRDLDGYTLTDPSGEAEISFNITDARLQNGEVARNFGAFHELCLHGDELCVTRWNVETGNITRDFFPFLQGDEWVSMIRREDPEGNALLFSYDQQQKLTSITQQHEQRGLQLEYDSQGHLVRVYRKAAGLTDTQQEATPFLQYDYDEQGRLAKFTDPLGACSYYKYDLAHRLINELTLAGMVYTFRFDGKGRCIYLSGDNDFDLHNLQYDDHKRRTEVTNAKGHVTTYYCNQNSQVEKVISSKGQVQTTLYDEDDRIVAEVMPSGAATQYTYDAFGNRCSITSPDGSVVLYTFNTQHQVITVTDPLGNQWQRNYDAQGRLVGLVNPLGARQQFAYNSHGDLINHRDDNGNARQFQWDGNGNLQSATDWRGNRSNYAWDAFGNLSAYTDAAGHTTYMVRNRVGHLLELTLPDGNRRQYEWDVFYNLKHYTDENGVSRRWAYSACGKIEQEFKPDGSRITYGWNAVPGQLAQLTNEKGELYHFRYDEEGRLVEEMDFSGAITTYMYNPDGQITEVRKPSMQVTRFRHDGAGRITDVLHDDGSMVSYQYDARGLLLKADNKDCPVSFAYDALGR
ncbi:partial putative deoxyribonuclease RhsA, partial [Anaerolineae bacterium]